MFRVGMGMFARTVAGSCALLAGLAVSVMTVPPAQASTAQGAALADVPLTSGTPVKAVISTPGQRINYTFSGKAKKHVTFQVTKFNLSNGGSGGFVYLNFYEPGSTSTYKSCGFSSDGYCDFTPPIAGTWKVQLVPNSASVGSLTLTMT